MKATLLGFFILALVVYLLVTPVARKMSACLEEANTDLESQQITMRTEKWDKETMCMYLKENALLLQGCYTRINSPLLIKTVELTTPLIRPQAKNLQQVISEHNEVCGAYPAALISDSVSK
jgi:hypothetical protein